MAETEVHLLTLAIDEINLEIRKLHHRRSQLITKLNTLTSATRHLPPEILTEIIRLSACKLNLREPRQLYYIDISSVLKFGAVCSQWRQITRSASNLWTTCLLTPPPPQQRFALAKDGISPLVHLTSLALGNCQPNNSVSIRVDLDDLCPQHMEILFNQYLTQLGALRLHMPDEDLVDVWNEASRYFRMSSEFPRLRELWVCWPERAEIPGLVLHPSGANADMDAVRYVRREGDCVPWCVPMGQLTVLRLCNVPVDQCVHLLLYCPNLVEFHCVDPTSTSGIYDQTSLLPVSECPRSLYNITQLRWRVFNEEWNLFLFSSIRFPRLERLFWGSMELTSSELFSPAKRMLYETFMPSLNHIRTLDLESPWPTNQFFVNETSFYALEQLYIVTSTSYSLVNWLESLTVSDNPSEQNLLPKLKILHVNICGVDISEARAFGALRRLLSSRCMYTGEGNQMQTKLERIIVETLQAPLWLEQDQMAVLKGFVAEGLVVEVVVTQDEGKGDIRTMLA